MNTEVCQVNVVHREKVETVINKLDGKDVSSLLILGKCFCDPSRIKIFYALETFKEMCVCDLAAVLDGSMAAASHHLQFLKKHGVVTSRKDGKVVYYSLANEEVLSAVRTFFTVSESLSKNS